MHVIPKLWHAYVVASGARDAHARTKDSMICDNEVRQRGTLGQVRDTSAKRAIMLANPLMQHDVAHSPITTCHVTNCGVLYILGLASARSVPL